MSKRQEVHVRVLSRLSCLSFVTPWTVESASLLWPWDSSVLEWVAISFSRGSSQPRDQTHISCVSCIADRCFTAEPLGRAWKYNKTYRKWAQNVNSSKLFNGFRPFDKNYEVSGIVYSCVCFFFFLLVF